MLPLVEFPATSGQLSILSPNPSESLSDHSLMSEGNASPESDHESPSVSVQPNVSELLFPNCEGHESGVVPSALSPNPSLSVSFHCVLSSGNESSKSAHESWSASKHPKEPLVEVPAVSKQSSSTSSYPSPSVSRYLVGSSGKSSFRSE